MATLTASGVGFVSSAAAPGGRDGGVSLLVCVSAAAAQGCRAPPVQWQAGPYDTQNWPLALAYSSLTHSHLLILRLGEGVEERAGDAYGNANHLN